MLFRSTATPLQAARLVAAVANGGKLVVPRVVVRLGPSRARTFSDLDLQDSGGDVRHSGDDLGQSAGDAARRGDDAAQAVGVAGDPGEHVARRQGMAIDRWCGAAGGPAALVEHRVPEAGRQALGAGECRTITESAARTDHGGAAPALAPTPC